MSNLQTVKTSELLRAAASILSIDQTPGGIELRDEMRRRAVMVEQEAHFPGQPGECTKESCETCAVLRAIGEMPPDGQDVRKVRP